MTVYPGVDVTHDRGVVLIRTVKSASAASSQTANYLCTEDTMEGAVDARVCISIVLTATPGQSELSCFIVKINSQFKGFMQKHVTGLG